MLSARSGSEAIGAEGEAIGLIGPEDGCEGEAIGAEAILGSGAILGTEASIGAEAILGSEAILEGVVFTGLEGIFTGLEGVVWERPSKSKCCGLERKQM